MSSQTAMYYEILEDTKLDDTILERDIKVYNTDDAAIFNNFAQTSNIFKLASKDPEKWLAFSESYLRIQFSLTNAAGNAAIADGEIATLINGGMSLFERARLMINDNQFEVVEKCGYVHVMRHLLESSLSKLNSVSHDEWIYIEGGKPQIGAYTAATAVPTAPFTTQTEAVGTVVNEFYGLADPMKYIGSAAASQNVGGLNPKFNSSFAARWTRTVNGRVVEISIPARMMFGYFADIRSAVQGLRVEIELTKNTRYTEIIHGMGATATLVAGAATGKAAAADAAVLIRKIEWRVPSLIPNSVELARTKKVLESGKTATKMFNSMTCYTNVIRGLTASASNPIEWRIQSTGRKVNRLIVAFQRPEQYGTQDDPDYVATTATHCNGGVYSHFTDITDVTLRVGSLILPRERYTRMSFADATPNMSRNYVDYLKAANNWDDEDGAAISMAQFKEIYPMFVFDLSAMDMNKLSIKTEDLIVQANITLPAAMTSLRALAFIETEYNVNFTGVNGRVAIELPSSM